MSIFLQFLVATVAVGLGVADQVPPYREYVNELTKAAITLLKNVLSLEGKKPLLKDSRCHYVEIINVINYHAKNQAGCPDIIRSYDSLYYQYLNISSPEAINTPEKVVSEIKNLLDEVHNNTKEVIDLINACTVGAEDCNELVNDTINANQDQYGKQAAVLIAAGKVAFVLNLENKEYEEVSEDLRAHQYVCQSREGFKYIVNELSNLHEILHPKSKLCGIVL